MATNPNPAFPAVEANRKTVADRDDDDDEESEEDEVMFPIFQSTANRR